MAAAGPVLLPKCRQIHMLSSFCLGKEASRMAFSKNHEQKCEVGGQLSRKAGV